MSKFICTDPDTNQWGRKLSCNAYEFHQTDVERTVIDLDDYTLEEKEVVIRAYGYTLYSTKDGCTNIVELYGEEWEWVLAEYIFESTI